MSNLGPNYQPFQPTPNQNYSPDPNYIPVQTSPNDGSISSRLASTRMVRIRIQTKCVCSELTCNKPFFQINTISKIDDLNPNNEGELPLLEAELFIPCCCPEPIKYNYIDAQTRQPFAISRYIDMIRQVGCCCGNYFAFPDIHHFKISEPNNISVTKCYDSRSFYRTTEYNCASFYKIGKPYVPVDCCEECCKDCCKCQSSSTDSCSCCCCCNKIEVVKRIYVDIFNMSNQCVGKYVRFYDVTGCCCSMKPTLFYEIYFPPDANEMLKLALIGQFIFCQHFGPDVFTVLPLTTDLNMVSLGNI